MPRIKAKPVAKGSRTVQKPVIQKPVVHKAVAEKEITRKEDYCRAQNGGTRAGTYTEQLKSFIALAVSAHFKIGMAVQKLSALHYGRCRIHAKPDVRKKDRSSAVLMQTGATWLRKVGAVPSRKQSIRDLASYSHRCLAYDAFKTGQKRSD